MGLSVREGFPPSSTDRNSASSQTGTPTASALDTLELPGFAPTTRAVVRAETLLAALPPCWTITALAPSRS